MKSFVFALFFVMGMMVSVALSSEDPPEEGDSNKHQEKQKQKQLRDPKMFDLKNDRTFRSLVFGNEYVWVVNFVNPDDDASNAFEPIYKEIARDLVGIVPAGIVNCKRTPGLCKRFSVTHYPYILLFPSEPDAAEDKIIKTPIEYEGEYTREAIVKECVKNVPDRISHIVDEEAPARLGKFLAEETPIMEDVSYLPHKFIIFSSEREGPSQTLTAMALNFHHLIDFCEVRKPTDATLAKFNLGREELPVMVIKLSPAFNNDVDESIRFTGKSTKDLIEFLTPYSNTVKEGIVALGNGEQQHNHQKNKKKEKEEEKNKDEL